MGRYRAVCWAITTSDVDECALRSHTCSTETYTSSCLSGLAHWYKLEPEDPLADSHGSNRMAQEPAIEAEEMYLYSRLDCVGKEEACVHWSPQPTPPISEWVFANNLYLQIPMAGMNPIDGITITFFYKRWTENKFGPRKRNLLCLRNATATTDNPDERECIWSLVLTSALETHLAVQALEFHPAGFFSLSTINVLDVERWYHIALVVRNDNTVQLYIDYERVGPALFFEWDSALYQTPNILEMELIQSEGRADIKVFNKALDDTRLGSRHAYMTCPVSWMLRSLRSMP